MGKHVGLWFNEPHLARLKDMYGIEPSQIVTVMRAFSRHALKKDWERYKRVAELSTVLRAGYATREGRVQVDPNQGVFDKDGQVFSEPDDMAKYRQEMEDLLNG